MARLVIPAGKTGADAAFQGKTWQQVADESGVSIAVQGDQWCVDNHFPADGLGIATEYVAPPAPVTSGPTALQTLIAALADARTMDDVAEAAAAAIVGGI